MKKKFTKDTIKDLKVRVKDLERDLCTKFYTKNCFQPDNTFKLFTEDCEIKEVNEDLVKLMIHAFENDKTEFDAGKILFENLDITPKQASDIGYWTYHNHYTFYPYIAKRWSDLWKDNVFNPSNYIINHWIQSNSNQGELIDYPISGLWWAFYLTVDHERKDKYELTRIFFKNLSLRTKYLGATRFARHKPAILGILEFIKENNLDTNSLEEAARAIVPYINLLGGIKPLTYFEKDWFKDKLQNRFGEQIANGEKLFVRPVTLSSQTLNEISLNKDSTIRKQKNYNRYFCLDANSGNYLISSKFDKNWDYCIVIDFEIEKQFLIHFYREGKIKKSIIDNTLKFKTVNRSKPYSNGKCSKLTLVDLALINSPVLFGIAYRTQTGTFFKAMDEQNVENFRIDNSDLNQEGKKVLYIDEPFLTAFKILPYELKNDLGSLLQKSPTSSGADIGNQYYEKQWTILKEYWPELFSNKLEWS